MGRRERINSPSLITAESPGMTRFALALISSTTEADRTIKPPIMTASPPNTQNRDSLYIHRDAHSRGSAAGTLQSFMALSSQ